MTEGASRDPNLGWPAASRARCRRAEPRGRCPDRDRRDTAMTDRLTAALAELAEALREELRAEAAADPRALDRLLSVHEAAAMLGLGRSVLYAEIGAGRLATLKVGRRRL